MKESDMPRIPLKSKKVGTIKGREFEATIFKMPNGQFAAMVEFDSNTWSDEERQDKGRKCSKIMGTERMNSRIFRMIAKISDGAVPAFYQFEVK
jgi:hypothetical protein